MEPNLKQILLLVGVAFIMALNSITGVKGTSNEELMKYYQKLYEEYATKKIIKMEASRKSAIMAH